MLSCHTLCAEYGSVRCPGTCPSRLKHNERCRQTHTPTSMLIPASETVPSIGNLAITCAMYGALGYGLARLRWWAGIPFLLFLAMTLVATLKRLDDFRAIGPLPPAFTPHYLAYHSLATAVAVTVIVLGMRQQRLARHTAKRVEARPAV